MKNICLISLFVFLFSSCDSDKRNAVRELNKLETSIDSVNKVYSSIDWNQYKKVSQEMNLQIDFVKQNSELIGQIDRRFVEYFGPYSAAGKMLSRVFKKRNKKIELELELAKTQIGNLEYDIKNGIIQGNDSILYFINSEHLAVDIVCTKVGDLQKSLNQQMEAYMLTHEKVDSLINVAKQNR